MITRLQIDGFKNLRGVDVRFDAFTCVAGGTGVGESNLFDAIRFLSALADEKNWTKRREMFATKTTKAQTQRRYFSRRQAETLAL
jgi:AAA15 family ATPase/GTPase